MGVEATVVEGSLEKQGVPRRSLRFKILLNKHFRLREKLYLVVYLHRIL